MLQQKSLELHQITTSKEILNLQKLTKSFDGKTNVVDDVSFIVSGGEIFGFLGPNDAGKSTTINMLTTILRPTSGDATICGYDLVKNQTIVRSPGYSENRFLK